LDSWDSMVRQKHYPKIVEEHDHKVKNTICCNKIPVLTLNHLYFVEGYMHNISDEEYHRRT